MRRVMAAHGLRVLLSDSFSIMPDHPVDNLRHGKGSRQLGRASRTPVPVVRLVSLNSGLAAEGSHFHMANASKTEMLENLRGMLRDVLRLRTEGVAYAKLSRAHGYLDGYMRVLLET